jgi:hypothetical protein
MILPVESRASSPAAELLDGRDAHPSTTSVRRSACAPK